MRLFSQSAMLITLAVLCGSLNGCGQSPAPQADPKVVKAEHPDHPGHVDGDEHGDHKHGDHSHAKDGHSGDGWWCDEHGVPEGECGLCDSKLAAAFQKKGDWCKEHDRPDSQCFVCHPEKQAEFAAKYEAKYGKQPPKPTL